MGLTVHQEIFDSEDLTEEKPHREQQLVNFWLKGVRGV